VISSYELSMYALSFSAVRILTPYRLFYKLKFGFFSGLNQK
jgi:hypothetical protein